MRSPDGLPKLRVTVQALDKRTISRPISRGELSRSSVVPLWPVGEPAQLCQLAGELGTSPDRVHRAYLDSGAEERARGAPVRHSLENSCSMSVTPSRPHSTPMCSGTMGEQ